MKTQEFCFWLQGFFELAEAKELSAKQVEIIKNHLNLVFAHDIDPGATEELPEEKAQEIQKMLNEIHKPNKQLELFGNENKNVKVPIGGITYRC